MINKTNKAIEKTARQKRSLLRDKRGGGSSFTENLGLIAIVLAALAAFVAIGKAISNTGTKESQGIQKIYGG